ncbi:MAG: co-chaperone GroES [Clostridia bacterium]|nr:co-chaperone GroES [Clostridia bacterium]
MNFKPLFDRVVLKNINGEKKTKYGIFIPESVGDEPLYAEVIAVGPGDDFDGNKAPMSVSIGDKVLYNKYGATTFKCDDECYVILRQSDILGVFSKEE